MTGLIIKQLDSYAAYVRLQKSQFALIKIMVESFIIYDWNTLAQDPELITIKKRI